MNLNEDPRGGTFCLGNAGVIIAALAKANAETLADIPYCINGLMYTLTSGAGDIQLDGHTVTSLYTALFVVCVNSSGTISVVKGTEVSNADITAGNKVLKWPEPTANTCPIAGLKIKNATASVFTGGTTLLDAANITFTAYNFFTVPAAPLTS